MTQMAQKGGLRDHFLGVLAHNVKLRALSTLLSHFGGILGHFWASWGLKPQNLLSCYVSQYWPPKAQWYVQNGEKLKIRPPGAVWSAF